MVLRVPEECRSPSDSQPLTNGVFSFSLEVSMTGHEHTAHVGSRQQVHNEK
jgi:hypothetical protein